MRGKVVIKINKKLFRPTDLNFMKGDTYKASTILKWRPKVTFKKLIKLMIDSEMHEKK